MSTTVTLTMAQASGGAGLPCESCGGNLQDAQKQIEDLKAQVRILNQKAASAADKLADYEDEIHSLRTAQKQQQQQQQQPDARGAPLPPDEQQRSDSPSRFSYLPVQNRLSSFLTSKKSTPNLQPPPPTPSTPSAEDLAAALTREQALRQAAEGKLNASSAELEDLTAQLFEQANEMVATERKARAKLEARVEVLEKRDVEKRKRLDKLEASLQRIERVRGLLAPTR